MSFLGHIKETKLCVCGRLLDCDYVGGESCLKIVKRNAKLTLWFLVETDGVFYLMLVSCQSVLNKHYLRSYTYSGCKNILALKCFWETGPWAVEILVTKMGIYDLTLTAPRIDLLGIWVREHLTWQALILRCARFTKLQKANVLILYNLNVQHMGTWNMCDWFAVFWTRA